MPTLKPVKKTKMSCRSLLMPLSLLLCLACTTLLLTHYSPVFNAGALFLHNNPVNLRLLPVKTVEAFYIDGESVKKNSFNTARLDLELSTSGISYPGDSGYLMPGESAYELITVENTGNLEFYYSLEAEDFSESASLCEEIKLRVLRKVSDVEWPIVYDGSTGSLEDFSLNSGGTAPDMLITHSDANHIYKFEYSLPENSPSDLSSSKCSFELTVKAWQPGFQYKQAYWDVESENTDIRTGNWLLDYGFESYETLSADDDGNPALGFCAVNTTYTDETEGKAPQIIKWETLEDAFSYKIIEYKFTDGRWEENKSLDLDGESEGLEVGEQVTSYSGYMSEGEYAYFIRIYNEDGDLLKATYPEDSDFSCTYRYGKTLDEKLPEGLLMTPLSLEVASDFTADETPLYTVNPVVAQCVPPEVLVEQETSGEENQDLGEVQDTGEEADYVQETDSRQLTDTEEGTDFLQEPDSEEAADMGQETDVESYTAGETDGDTGQGDGTAGEEETAAEDSSVSDSEDSSPPETQE